MDMIKTNISDVFVFEPKIFTDERGFFFESYNENEFQQCINRKVEFIQDNHSKSEKGVLRGLHYQLSPKAQAKLVRCVIGEIFDVAVDIRKSSPTFGQWVGVILSAKNKRQLWIPEGFAHGFIALKDGTEILYKTNNFYCHELERSIRWNDNQLSIEWPIKVKNLSKKDKYACAFKNAEIFRD